MRMSLEKIQIQNFKGIRDLAIDFGETTHIYGMNGTGKTTIPDAFCWVLYGKDSHGNSPGSNAFREKPLDESGREIHGLDTTVELICTLDGKPFNLKRTQRENWVKKRGNADATYQGNTSIYWINDVKITQSDFVARISQIAKEEVFRLIGSLSAFNQIEWKKRRQQLLVLSDSDVDETLLASDTYRVIADEAAQRNISVDDLRKVLSDQKKRTNEELKMMPVRIDEAQKALPTFKPTEIRDAEYSLKESTDSIARIDGYIAEAKATGGRTNTQQQILALETELLSHKRRVMDDFSNEKRRLQNAADDASANFRRLSAEVADIKAKMQNDEIALSRAVAARDSLRTEYSKVYESRFNPQGNCVCPTCNQPLPPESIAKTQAEYEEKRKKSLADIKQQGKSAATEVQRIEASLANAKDRLAELERMSSTALMERDAAYDRIKIAPSEPDYAAETRIAEIEQQITDLRKEQAESPDERVRSLEDRKAELTAIVDRNRAILARRDAGKATEQRIVELEQRQRELGNRVSELEQLIDLAEHFVQDRCAALEESINEKFPTIRWKLFETQINGGINDVCICMIPCASGLVDYESANTAARINADIEIINVLSKYYDLSLPLFVDNKERVNVLEKTDSQLITLSVSTDSELRIETNKEAT